MHFNQTKRKNKVKWLYHEFYDGGPYKWSGYWINETPRAHRLHLHRQIKTFTERRDNCLTADESYYGVYARGRRSTRALPEPWDDLMVSAQDYTRSWKHNSKRKKQWKYE